MHIWSPVKPGPAAFRIEDLPAKVPVEQLDARIWIASFTSPTQRESVFSLELSPDLFDKPRRINLKLDRPRLRIRPNSLGGLRFWYYGGISRRMRYRTLPYWDEERKKLVRAEPPVLRILRAADGTVLQESEMAEGCMGSKWYGKIDRSVDLGRRADLRLVVRYDSGGLWKPIDTRLDFTYAKGWH